MNYDLKEYLDGLTLTLSVDQIGLFGSLAAHGPLL